MPKGNSICVKVYFKPEAFAVMANLAEESGKRRKGLLLYTLKPNGFAGEKLANTDGIAKFLKYAAQDWADHRSERLARAAEIMAQEQALAKEKARLGII